MCFEQAAAKRAAALHRAVRRRMSHRPSATTNSGHTRSPRSHVSKPMLLRRKYNPSTISTAGQKYSRRQKFMAPILTWTVSDRGDDLEQAGPLLGRGLDQLWSGDRGLGVSVARQIGRSNPP